jgi:histidinol-phosphate aminotransferase
MLAAQFSILNLQFSICRLQSEIRNLKSEIPLMPYFRPEILAMSGYVPGEQPQDDGFIKLNTNENPYPPSPAVAAAVAAAVARLPKYPDPTAGAFRRQAAAALGVPPDWVLCGNGSDDILTIVTRALVGPGQRLAFPYPTYILYRTLAQLQGAESREIQFRPDWSLPDDFAAQCADAKLVCLANPNSPSGTMLGPQQVLALAERLPCPLLVDEAYADFADTNCMDLVARCERIMVSRSFSKSYALAGLRFGYLVAQPALIEQFVKVKDSYNCDTLAIAAAAAAIADRDWLAANRAKIVAARGRLLTGMRDLGFVAVPSQANFTWNTHPHRPVRPLYEELKRRRILVRYMDYPRWGDGLRVSVGADDQIEALLNALRAIL